MKKNKPFIIVTFCATSLLLVMSCTKSNNNVDPRIEMIKKYLSQKDWVIDKYIGGSLAGGLLVDVSAPSSILEPCMVDDTLKITADNKFDFQEGTLVCSPKTLPYGKGQWTYDLKTDSLTLTINTPAKKMSWKITKLDDTIMEGTTTDLSQKYRKDITFKHPKK